MFLQCPLNTIHWNSAVIYIAFRREISVHTRHQRFSVIVYSLWWREYRMHWTYWCEVLAPTEGDPMLKALHRNMYLGVFSIWFLANDYSKIIHTDLQQAFTVAIKTQNQNLFQKRSCSLGQTQPFIISSSSHSQTELTGFKGSLSRLFVILQRPPSGPSMTPSNAHVALFLPS